MRSVKVISVVPSRDPHISFVVLLIIGMESCGSPSLQPPVTLCSVCTKDPASLASGYRTKSAVCCLLFLGLHPHVLGREGAVLGVPLIIQEINII